MHHYSNINNHLIDDHTFVLKFLPELFILIITGAELEILLDGENSLHLLHQTADRGLERGGLALRLVGQQGALRAQFNDIQTRWAERGQNPNFQIILIELLHYFHLKWL